MGCLPVYLGPFSSTAAWMPHSKPAGAAGEPELKCVGEVERGRPTSAWPPWNGSRSRWNGTYELPLREQDALPEVRMLLPAELTHMQHLVQTTIGWLQTLEAGNPASSSLFVCLRRPAAK